jgi:hypothetical protein
MKGKDTLIPNLPRPTAQLIQEHAYISLRDCVYGFDVDNIVGVIGTDHVEEVSQIGQCMYSKGYIIEGKKFMDPIHWFALILLNGVMALNHQYQQK